MSICDRLNLRMEHLLSSSGYSTYPFPPENVPILAVDLDGVIHPHRQRLSEVIRTYCTERPPPLGGGGGLKTLPSFLESLAVLNASFTPK